MKRLLLIVAALLSLHAVSAQETVTVKEEKPIKFKPYGFVRNYFYYDSRQNLQSSNGLFNQIPKDEDNNNLGEDMNEVASSSFLAITTRLGLNVTGPDVLGAASSAKIETDFSGFSSSTTMLRIRQAYMKLDWKRNSVLAGQTWHPMYGDVFPDVLALSSGSPFQPFSRAPQVRYDYRISSLKLSLAALYQLQYLSVYPDEPMPLIQRMPFYPNSMPALSSRRTDLRWQAGVDYSRIKPRSTADVEYQLASGKDTTIKRKVSDYVQGISPMVYFKYTIGQFGISARSVLGQNTAHLNMMSGYGVSGTKSDGSLEYTPLRNSTSWVDISYGKKFKGNLFLGYSKNLGTSDDVIGTVYVRGYNNIDQFYRIAPSFSYNLKHFNIGIEYELTTVAYGKKIDKKCKVSDTHNVSNNRICGMIKYNF